MNIIIAVITCTAVVPWSRDMIADQSVKQSTMIKYVHPACEQRSTDIPWKGLSSLSFWIKSSLGLIGRWSWHCQQDKMVLLISLSMPVQ